MIVKVYDPNYNDKLIAIKIVVFFVRTYDGGDKEYNDHSYELKSEMSGKDRERKPSHLTNELEKYEYVKIKYVFASHRISDSVEKYNIHLKYDVSCVCVHLVWGV